MILATAAIVVVIVGAYLVVGYMVTSRYRSMGDLYKHRPVVMPWPKDYKLRNGAWESDGRTRY